MENYGSACNLFPADQYRPFMLSHVQTVVAHNKALNRQEYGAHVPTQHELPTASHQAAQSQPLAAPPVSGHRGAARRSAAGPAAAPERRRHG